VQKIDLKEVTKIIVHCSDSDIEAHDDIAIVRQWHLDRGWDDVGYQYFIQKDGNLQYGRYIDMAGAHCRGYNTSSVGICLSGKNDFTFKQFVSLHDLVDALRITLGSLDVFPHRHFNNNKTCPNFNLKELGL